MLEIVSSQIKLCIWPTLEYRGHDKIIHYSDRIFGFFKDSLQVSRVGSVERQNFRNRGLL
jgi:hypothetical protein